MLDGLNGNGGVYGNRWNAYGQGANKSPGKSGAAAGGSGLNKTTSDRFVPSTQQTPSQEPQQTPAQAPKKGGGKRSVWDYFKHGAKVAHNLVELSYRVVIKGDAVTDQDVRDALSGK